MTVERAGAWRRAVVGSLAVLIATGALAACGGGGDGSDASESEGPPPAAEVQSTVEAILDKCIEVGFDPSVDTQEVSVAVDKQIQLFRDYDPDARLGESDLKQKTMREVLQQSRENLRDCQDDDAERVSAALTGD